MEAGSGIEGGKEGRREGGRADWSFTLGLTSRARAIATRCFCGWKRRRRVRDDVSFLPVVSVDGREEEE